MNDVSLHRPVRPATLLVLATALIVIGLVMVASTSVSLDRPVFGAAMFRTPFGRQLVFAAAGLIVLLLTAQVAVPVLSSPIWRRWVTRTLFALAVIGLIAALIPGLAHEQRGSSRWLGFSVGGFAISVQPSEIAKVAMVALLALLLGDGTADRRSFGRYFLPAACVIGLCVALVGKEDFGTSVLLAGVGAGMLLMAGCRWLHLGGMALLGTSGLTALLLAEPYRLQRLIAYWDVWNDQQGAGYQPIQSLTSIASGGWLGTGLGSGVQKYGYLPESHTDFIFAVICEEMGVFGGCIVIALFAVFIWLGLRIMWSARSRFERLLAFGLTATVGLQAAMNIAVVTVLAPTTGISLPLISAGGSGLVTFCFVLGLLGAMACRNITQPVGSPPLMAVERFHGVPEPKHH